MNTKPKFDLDAEMLKDETMRVIVGATARPSAQEKYSLSNDEVKRLRGRIHRNDIKDPIGSLEHDCVYDDWRLEKFVKTMRESVKSRD